MSSETAFKKPFNDALAVYAMRFAQPVIFGESPLRAYTNNLWNGTASLLRLGDRYLAITCFHVYDAYRQAHLANPATIFQVGKLEFEPEPYLISESRELDLAVLDVTQLVRPDGLLEPLNFVEAVSWPPTALEASDILAFAGFPGVWREQLTLGYLRFFSVTVGTGEIASLHEDHLYTRLAFDEAEVAIRDGLVIGSLGGLSGGPVFAWRAGTILRAELIGFAIEYQEALDLLYVRRATVLGANGQLPA